MCILNRQRSNFKYDVTNLFYFNIIDKNGSSQLIPDEINTHLQIFGKDSWEMNYSLFGNCQFCNCRISELDYCACGGSAE
jgi:hypothetical protein